MGIYIFNTKTLIEYLEADEADEKSSNDFGKNIIPNLLNNGEKLYSYKFDGYWKDVGTISSLWEANMDLIGDEPALNLADRKFRIFSKNTARAPQFHGEKSEVKNALISVGCRIYGSVRDSVLSGGVVVEEGAVVSNSFIMEDVVIKKDAHIYTAIVDSDTVVGEGAVVGNPDIRKDEIVVIAKNSVIADHSVVNK